MVLACSSKRPERSRTYRTVTRTYPLDQQHWSLDALSGARQLSTCALKTYEPGALNVA